MTGEAIIRLRDVAVRAEDRDILAIGRLEIFPGERVAVIGNSGAGKTTLMRMLKGYVTPSRGRPEVLGTSLPIRDRGEERLHHRRIGMIHQGFDLIGRETVWQNVYHGRLSYIPLAKSVFSLSTERDREICLLAIREVHLDDMLDRSVRTLSGGEQQRVAIARALSQEPTILLADEPVSNLDPTLAEDILDLIVSVCDAYQLTLLASLHLPELARRYARRVIAMKGGKIIWDGSSDELTDDKVQEIYGRSGIEGGTNGRARRTNKSILRPPHGYQGLAAHSG